MTLEIILPETKESKGIKDLIISILTNNYPLTLKKIHNQIKKKYVVRVSYQAVHKAVNELISKGIIEKKKKEYKLNIEWIRNIKDFCGKLEKNYKSKFSLKEPGNFTVNTIWELYLIFIDLFKSDIFKASNKSICFIGNIMLNPQIGSKKEIDDLKELSKKYKWFIISRNNSLLDRIWKTYWEKLGAKVKMGAKIFTNPSIDTFVVGDFIVQIFHNKKINENTRKFVKKVKKPSDIKIGSLHDLYFKNYGKIHVVTTKNEKLATLLRRKVEALFR